jgi:hypothetical protein
MGARNPALADRTFRQPLVERGERVLGARERESEGAPVEFGDFRNANHLACPASSDGSCVRGSCPGGVKPELMQDGVFCIELPAATREERGPHVTKTL